MLDNVVPQAHTVTLTSAPTETIVYSPQGYIIIQQQKLNNYYFNFVIAK